MKFKQKLKRGLITLYKCPECGFSPLKQKKFIALTGIVILFFLQLAMISDKIALDIYAVHVGRAVEDSPEMAEYTRDYIRSGKVACENATGLDYFDCIYFMVWFRSVFNTTYEADDWFEGVAFLNNDPWTTMEVGGDCENQAILALSMLKSIGKENIYFVLQDGHACWFANDQFWNCDPNRQYLFMQRVN